MYSSRCDASELRVETSPQWLFPRARDGQILLHTSSRLQSVPTQVSLIYVDPEERIITQLSPRLKPVDRYLLCFN